MGTVPVFASAAEAMQMVRAGLDYLAAADPAAMAAGEQARCRGPLSRSIRWPRRRGPPSWALHRRAGLYRRRRLQPRAWLIRKTQVQGRRRRLHRVGPALEGARADPG